MRELQVVNIHGLESHRKEEVREQKIFEEIIAETFSNLIKKTINKIKAQEICRKLHEGNNQIA